MVQNSGKSVLLARFSAFGDVAMAIPAIYSACRTYPHVHFVLVTRPSMVSMFVNAPENLTVKGYDLKDVFKGVNGIRRMTAEIVRTFHPHIFIDLHNVLRTNLMSVFLKLKGVGTVRIIKPRAQRKALTRSRNKIIRPLIPQLTRYFEAFSAAGLPSEDSFTGLFGGKDTAPEDMYAAITSGEKTGEKWIGIAPFAAHEGKIYPTQLMERVVEALQNHAEKSTLRIFLFGGGGREQEILDRWADIYPACTSLAGKKYGFRAELALMNHLDVMLSMDSANMHLAAIAGTRVLSLWGATHPFCGFSPWNGREEDMIQIPMECRPCSVFGNKPCLHAERLCLTSIPPEKVYEAIIKSL